MPRSRARNRPVDVPLTTGGGAKPEAAKAERHETEAKRCAAEASEAETGGESAEDVPRKHREKPESEKRRPGPEPEPDATARPLPMAYLLKSQADLSSIGNVCKSHIVRPGGAASRLTKSISTLARYPQWESLRGFGKTYQTRALNIRAFM